MRTIIFILALCSPLAAQQPERGATPAFLAVSGASIGMAALDVALTQRCIKMDRCREVNPLMQGGAARQYSLALGMAGVGVLIGYKMKRQGSTAWWIVPAASIAGHGVGVGLGLRF